MTYAEKLRDPRWQRKRLETMGRDGWACQRCHSDSKPLNVHHIHYAASGNPWDASNEWLVTLCEDCHAAISAIGNLPIPNHEQDVSRGGEDAIYEAFTEYGAPSPEPSVLAACRVVATEPTILRLVNRLAWEGKLRRYTEKPGAFLRIVEIYAESERGQ